MQLYVSHPLLINLHGFLKTLQHGGAVLGGFDDLLGGVDDALREVRRVRDDPLGVCAAACADEAQTQQNDFLFHARIDCVIEDIHPKTGITALSADPKPAVRFALPLQN